MKSMRILSKGLSKNLALTSKLNSEIGKRIDKKEVSNMLKHKFST